ncbi:hypothetical protein F3Y22_tig00110391pilonHSYRG00175 [Hibiscus syriacus]|uniref:DUF632 domain-containing protein n=1 Tax=Hibiscus syriacus TaxID=106335 RepID=A0A6A3AQX3_HIBSY|nr:hypothetical protein F3Y22_tig00110391pilonHSYRG00175 [Hibiscus syriacus]
MQPSAGTAEGSSSKLPPPPPPSPSRASAWDFLNPFQSYENYNPPYTPSRDSREVREEEGIPDLEDEDYHHEVVKEVHGDQKFVDGGGQSMPPVEAEYGKVASSEAEASHHQARPSDGMENDGVEYEVHVVDKKVVDDEKFVRASDSGSEIGKLLEVETLHYQRKHGSKMLHVVNPSLSVVSSSQPLTSEAAEASSSTYNTDPALLDFGEELSRKPKTLSSTLQKLYLWEKKLYNEIKAEEKMRVGYDRKCRKLKRLDEKGAEANKVDSTRNIIRSLSKKLRIAIQVVDKISLTINKIRDDELWPLLDELIEGLSRMWKCMLECHRNQYQVIREAETFGSIGSGKKLGDDHFTVTLQLKHELISWTLRFCRWMGAQKGFVRALNNWLLKCLYYEPEVTDDGISPFSPSREDGNGLSVAGHAVYQSETSNRNMQGSLQRIFEAMESSVVGYSGPVMHNFAGCSSISEEIRMGKLLGVADRKRLPTDSRSLAGARDIDLTFGRDVRTIHGFENLLRQQLIVFYRLVGIICPPFH